MRALALAMALTALAPAVAAAAPSKRIALVVGVNDFDDDRWPDLRFAQKDAEDVATALSGFDEIIRVADGEVTRDRFIAALDRLHLINTSDRDTVVVFVSTHGTLARDDAGALARLLVFSDTSFEEARATGMPYDRLTEAIDRLRSRKRLVILAACHAGAGKSVLPADLAKELAGLKSPFFEAPVEASSEGRVVLAASAWGEPAREDDGLENDVYTHFFVQALAGFDRNDDGATTATEAHDYARRQTMAFTQGRQRPTLSAEIVGDDPIVLAGERSRSGDPVIAAYGEAFEGATLEIDGRVKGVLPGGYVVEPGDRVVRVVHRGANSALMEQTFDVDAGAVVVLDRHVDIPTARWLADASIGYQFVRGAVGNELLPGFGLMTVGLARENAARTWRAGLHVGVGFHDAPIDVVGPGGTAATTQTAWVLKPGLSASVAALRLGRFELRGTGELGWIVGRRTPTLELLEAQTLSFAYGGVGLAAAFRFHPAVTFEARGGLDLFVLRAKDRMTAVAADRYAAVIAIAL